MIPVTKTGQTVKKSVLLPDKIVENIDKKALGEYTNRPDFVLGSIRSLVDTLQDIEDNCARELGNTHLSDDKILEIVYKEIDEYISFKKLVARTYESDDSTQITIYVPIVLLVKVHTYIEKDGLMRNFQDFTRIATTKKLEEIGLFRTYCDYKRVKFKGLDADKIIEEAYKQEDIEIDEIAKN